MSHLIDPFRVLGLTESVTDEQVRSAYMQAVRRHPPEQSPEAFARISGAYDQIRTEERRLRLRFTGPFPQTWQEARDMMFDEGEVHLPKREAWMAEAVRVRAMRAASALHTGKEASS